MNTAFPNRLPPCDHHDPISLQQCHKYLVAKSHPSVEILLLSALAVYLEIKSNAKLEVAQIWNNHVILIIPHRKAYNRHVPF